MKPIATSGFWPELRWGELQLSPYFLIISLVMSAIAWRLPKWADAERLSPRRALDLFIATSVAGFVGARFMHIIWEEPAYYGEDLMRVLEVWRGGFVWMGGLIGGFAVGVVMLRRWREPIWPWLDFFAPVLALGYAGGRVACWAVGCCHGWVCELGAQAWVLPSQGFAVFWELGLWWILRRQSANKFLIWMLGHGLGRMLMELMRGDERGPSLALGWGSSTLDSSGLELSISMGLSILMMLIATYGLVRSLVSKGAKTSP